MVLFATTLTALSTDLAIISSSSASSLALSSALSSLPPTVNILLPARLPAGLYYATLYTGLVAAAAPSLGYLLHRP